MLQRAQVYRLGCGDSSSGPGLLPRDAIVSLDTVIQYFSEITQQASTGANETLVGSPIATRSVMFTNGDGKKKVTLSVDLYASVRAASASFDEAVKLSEAAPGYLPAPPPDLGEQAFAGSSRVGQDMHFGLGAREGKVIMSATYAGFPVTPENSNALITLGGLVLEANEDIAGS